MATSIPYILCSKVNLFLIGSAIIGSVLVSHSVFATSCQVYPSEYAYKDDSVTRHESNSANCRRYPVGNLPLGDHPEDFIHCDGTQLKLADSTFGQEQYWTRDYYVWSADRDGQLLFIFPARVSLTTITLYYYSDNIRGLPRLRFYAVPDDFNVWDALTTGTPYADVAAIPSGGESAGRRNISKNLNFNTTKVLMYKHSSTFKFEVSEVQFFNCSCKLLSNVHPIPNELALTMHTAVPITIITTDTTSLNPDTKLIQATDPMSISNLSTVTVFTGGINQRKFQSDSLIITTTYNSVIQNNAANSASVLPILIGISVAILIVLTAVVVITLVLLYLRKSTKQKANSDYDNSYSTLCRGDTQQLQSHSQQAPTDLYDQIHLSPSTGQAEVISNAEIENINSLPSHHTDNLSNTDKDRKQSGLSNVLISEQPTYAAVKKKQKKSKLMKGKKSEQNRNSAAEEKVMLCSLTATDKTDMQKNHDQEEATPTTTELPEALYTAVKKKPNNNRADNEEKVPPPPLHSVEELYTAVKKNIKGSTMEEEEGAPQIPPHTVKELYTAVMKEPKDDPKDYDKEAAPPIPPHTVEELYAAVQKGSIAKNEEEAPPIPPHTVEDCC